MSNASNCTEKLPHAEGVVFCVIFVAEFVAIVVVNVLTIMIFRRDPNLKQAKFYLLVNLAVADLLVGIVCGPFWTFNLAFSFDLWPAPYHIPLLWRRFLLEMAEHLAKYASLISLTMIAVERMFATLQPVKYRKLGCKTRHVLIAICWGLAALFSLNYLAAAVLNVISHETALYLMLGAMCSLLLVTSLCYVAVWVKVKFSPHGETSERELKLTTSLFVVTVVSLTTWLPNQVYFSIQMIRMVRDHKSVSMNTFNRVINLTAMLLFANSLVNPIIYAFRIPHFKKTFMKIFCKTSGRESLDHEGIQLNKLGPPAHCV